MESLLVNNLWPLFSRLNMNLWTKIVPYDQNDSQKILSGGGH